MRPLVSVVTITYNHEKYIEKCIEGVLMQEVDFPIEFIIAEDCSTDGTLSICKRYEAEHPEIIKLITSGSNVGSVINEQSAFLAARGKYIATCEGDDYWTDPLKLQKQVDFLEANHDYSVCFHRYSKLNGTEIEEDGCGIFFKNKGINSIELSIDQAISHWATQYLTMVFRRNSYDYEAYKRYKFYRDTHQVYHLMLNGKCRLFSFNGGVYRMTGAGIYSNLDAFDKEFTSLKINEELYHNNKDIRWREICDVIMQNMIYQFSSEIKHKPQMILFSVRLFVHNKNFRRFIRNVIR